jgi:hypothetical protein
MSDYASLVEMFDRTQRFKEITKEKLDTFPREFALHIGCRPDMVAATPEKGPFVQGGEVVTLFDLKVSFPDKRFNRDVVVGSETIDGFELVVRDGNPQPIFRIRFDGGEYPFAGEMLFNDILQKLEERFV